MKRLSPLSTCLILSLLAVPVAAQEFAFRQACVLRLQACDMVRDGSDSCPTGQPVEVEFWAEGESFQIRVAGGGGTGFGPSATVFGLGQGYFDDRLRVYYLLDQPQLDGVFWISVADGTAGAQLTWGGKEDYFGGSCLPLP